MNGITHTLQAFITWLEKEYDIVPVDKRGNVMSDAMNDFAKAYENRLDNTTIYVDEVRRHDTGFYAHMWTNGDEEALHQAALRLGLPRRICYQKSDDMVDFPHYWLSPGRRRQVGGLYWMVDVCEVRLADYLAERNATP